MKAEKRKYEKPSMQVVVLKQRPQLLAGSGDGYLNPMGDPYDL